MKQSLTRSFRIFSCCTGLFSFASMCYAHLKCVFVFFQKIYVFLNRLNSGPLKDFIADVGNRTSIRMTYPEGCPKVWEDTDSDLKFVAVIYKSVDFLWLRAMITETAIVSGCNMCYTSFFSEHHCNSV